MAKTEEWIARISQDRKFQEDERHPIWKRNIERFAYGSLYRHNYDGPHGHTGLHGDFVNVNFVYAYIKTVVPAIYFRDPYIFAAGRKEEDVGKANVIEAIINYVWREINLKDEVKRAIIDTLFFGIGWVKIGYTAEFGRTIADSSILPEGTSDRETPEGKVIEFNEFVKEENVFGKRISPFRMIVPRGYHRFIDMPYVIEERLEDIEAIRDNKSYKNTKNLVPTHKLDTGFESIKAPNMTGAQGGLLGRMVSKLTHKEQANKVIIWEVWDKREKKVLTFGKGSDLALQEKDWDLDIEGFPYVPLRFNVVPDSDEHSNFYPTSDIEPLIPQLNELSKLRTAMVKHRKRWIPKVIIQKGAMSQEQINVYKEPETGLIAEADDINGVKEIRPAPVPPDLYKINAEIKADLREISGISQLLLGGGGAPGVNTATEANIIQQGAGLRINEKQDQVEDFTRTIARKMIQILRQYVDRTFRLRTFIEGKEVDITGTKEDLQAEVDVKIEAGSTQPPTDTAIERKQLIDLALGVIAHPFFQRFANPRLLLMEIFKTFPSLKPSLTKLLAGGIEDEIQIAQLENQLMQQGQIQLVHPNDDHDVHMQVHAQLAQSPETTTPEVAQHIKSHNDFMVERQSGPNAPGGRAEGMTGGNIMEGGSMRPADTFALGREKGAGTSPPSR
jgi:hypothetical protein